MKKRRLYWHMFLVNLETTASVHQPLSQALPAKERKHTWERASLQMAIASSKLFLAQIRLFIGHCYRHLCSHP